MAAMNNVQFPPIADIRASRRARSPIPEVVRFEASKIGLSLPKNETVEWMNVAVATFALGVESAGVVVMRALRAANGGPRAAQEAWRMGLEKIITLAELQARLYRGALGATPLEVTQKSVTYCRQKVAANCRRLSQG